MSARHWILSSFIKLCVGNDFFFSNPTFFLNIIIIFREQFPLLELYEWQQRLGLKIKSKQTGKLIACMCVCLGLIMGAVDRSHHRTGALIGEAALVLWSHWAYSALLGSWLVGLNGYLSCEWWRRQPIWSEWTSFYVRKRGIRAFRRELTVSRCCVSHKPGSSPRVTLILSSPPSFPSTHQQSQACCGDLATTLQLPRWL